jgi:iron complex transport system ATP-binding protein
MKKEKIPILETNALSIGYPDSSGSSLLFSELNLSLLEGELVCFMGRNGVGKSTLIRALAGLQKPLSGSVRLSGGENGDLPRLLAVVLTDKVSAGSMTVHELIKFGRYPYLGWNIKLSDEDHRVVERAISQINLSAILNKKISELSDGQMQMVMIARALAQDTPVMLLDEPTAHLDLNNRVEIMKLLKDLAHKMNKAILVATHELDLALQTADRIWLAGKNKDILQGLPEDLVLNGAFDDIFQFKGFDLKSGKVQHEVTRTIVVMLEGQGHDFLWTKNALERSGFEVKTSLNQMHDTEAVRVVITYEGGKTRWILTKSNRSHTLDTISNLIEFI